MRVGGRGGEGREGARLRLTRSAVAFAMMCGRWVTAPLRSNRLFSSRLGRRRRKRVNNVEDGAGRLLVRRRPGVCRCQHWPPQASDSVCALDPGKQVCCSMTLAVRCRDVPGGPDEDRACPAPVRLHRPRAQDRQACELPGCAHASSCIVLRSRQDS